METLRDREFCQHPDRLSLISVATEKCAEGHGYHWSLIFVCNLCGQRVDVAAPDEWRGMDWLDLETAGQRQAREAITVKTSPPSVDRSGHSRITIVCRPETKSITGRQFGQLVYFAHCECGWVSESVPASKDGREAARSAGWAHWAGPSLTDDLDRIDDLVKEWAKEK